MCGAVAHHAKEDDGRVWIAVTSRCVKRQVSLSTRTLSVSPQLKQRMPSFAFAASNDKFRSDSPPVHGPTAGCAAGTSVPAARVVYSWMASAAVQWQGKAAAAAAAAAGSGAAGVRSAVSLVTTPVTRAGAGGTHVLSAQAAAWLTHASARTLVPV